MSAKLTFSFAALVALMAAACASEVETPDSAAAPQAAESFRLADLPEDLSQTIAAHAEKILRDNPEANLKVVQTAGEVTIEGDVEVLQQLSESLEATESPQQKAKPRWCFQYGIERTGAWVGDRFDKCLGDPLGPLCHSGLYWTQLGANLDAVAWAAGYGCSATISVKRGSCPATHSLLSCW